MAFRLRIAEGKGAGREFYFAKSPVRVGRLPDNDLVLYDTGVSRHHCEIIKDGERFTLRDTGSANGTLLNEQLATEAQLSEGDRIGVGPITFAFSAAVELPRDGRQGGDLGRPEDARARKALGEAGTRAFGRGELAAARQRAGLPPESAPSGSSVS